MHTMYAVRRFPVRFLEETDSKSADILCFSARKASLHKDPYYPGWFQPPMWTPPGKAKD